jgi:hypothetical protein
MSRIREFWIGVRRVFWVAVVQCWRFDGRNETSGFGTFITLNPGRKRLWSWYVFRWVRDVFYAAFTISSPSVQSCDGRCTKEYRCARQRSQYTHAIHPSWKESLWWNAEFIYLWRAASQSRERVPSQSPIFCYKKKSLLYRSIFFHLYGLIAVIGWRKAMSPWSGFTVMLAYGCFTIGLRSRNGRFSLRLSGSSFTSPCPTDSDHKWPDGQM